MSVETKGFLYGKEMKNFTIDRLKTFLKSNYKNVNIEFLIVDGYAVMSFIDNSEKKSEVRHLSIFTKYESYRYENYPKIDNSDSDGDYNHIILFTLGCGGNSFKIIKEIILHFGGGYVIENDCSSNWIDFYNPYEHISEKDSMEIFTETKELTEAEQDSKRLEWMCENSMLIRKGGERSANPYYFMVYRNGTTSSAHNDFRMLIDAEINDSLK